MTTLTPDEIFEYVRARESGARTYATAFGQVLQEGHGARIRDGHGRWYLDCLAAAGTLALGHNHPEVLRRVRAYLESGQVQQALDLTTPAKYEFLSALYARLPGTMADTFRTQFCGPAGADAAEAAVKLFKTATGRRTVLAFHGAYHGMTAGALALTGSLGAKEPVASLMPDVHHLPYPYDYRCPFGLGGEQGVQVGLTYLERLLTDPESGITKPAAVFVEAVQGEGGVIPAPARWLRGLREITARLGIPLVLDEIQAGFGRTGTMWAFEESGIEPDAILVSKAVGGGFPLSLLLYHGQYDAWQPGAHAGTFRGNQIALVAGAAGLEVMEAEGLVGKAAAKGELLGGLLRRLAAAHPEIGDVRGRGLMWGIEIVDPEGPADALGAKPADPDRTRRIKRACLDHGLLLETGGRHGAVLRLLPPLVISDEELHEVVAALEKALIDCA
ncbi:MULTISPECIES: diaminobutyrate--2-oxoglutarate transaminase family protein [unclassified Streptomyces]|uniref:diaminobutyrate--2-oxoglutarate transaminase family protein n=1 Tax=unclassified Streptomyces TaxID=2593676 RepID=UPI0021C8F12A|nr:diaminobutyrate--2-oxoglutarate transaminase family protein [Streptomyces sp. FIT100]UUN30749.1 diaminobutyrate--2-oxoglutarate transaminase family protein [Streptomyces sp. FIT100]